MKSAVTPKLSVPGDTLRGTNLESGATLVAVTPHMQQENGEFAVPKIATATDDELRERRTQILAKLGVSFEDLRARAEQYALVGDEHEAWEDLQSIAFLLGETRA